jgi:hypothetical protein
MKANKISLIEYICAISIIPIVLLACGNTSRGYIRPLSAAQMPLGDKIKKSLILLPNGQPEFSLECEWKQGCIKETNTFCVETADDYCSSTYEVHDVKM